MKKNLGEINYLLYKQSIINEILNNYVQTLNYLLDQKEILKEKKI
jgi:hypothetical protein